MYEMLTTSTTTLIILTPLFLFLLYKWVINPNPNRHKNPPPSPPAIPLIGNFHQLAIGSQPLYETFRSLSRRYGAPDLMLLRLGTPTLVVCSAAAAKEVMKTHDAAFSDRTRSVKFEKMFYGCRDISTATYGEYWRQMKSISVVHLLSNKNVRSFRRLREQETHLMILNLRRSHNSQVNLSEIFWRLANDVVCQATLGRKFGDDEKDKKFENLMSEFHHIMAEINVTDYIPWLSWLNKVNGQYSKMDRVAKGLDQFFEQVLEDHQRRDGRNEDVEFKNFGDILLSIQRDNLLGFPIDRTSIKAILLDMFAAGIGTTSTTLELTMTELLKHPKTLKKLQDEVRSISGDKTEITEEDLQKMTYLKAVIKESLRLHPPFPLLVPRNLTQDTKVMGYDVAAGSQVFVNAWAIGRDPIIWGDDGPEEFRPERFIENNVDYKGQDFGMIPFGAGRRGCPGESFAMAINEIALANLVRWFDWSLSPSSSQNLPLFAIPKHI